jgi:hypothetical protein
MRRDRAALEQRERERRDRAARAEIVDLIVLAFLAESADGSRNLGLLLAHFTRAGGSSEELDEAVYRLEGRHQIERYQGLELYVTSLGRSRVGGRATTASA